MVRFIPTHVGNTSEAQADARLPPVHPHACGEHPTDRQGPHVHGGSSPRMWGTQLMKIGKEKNRRFIPTHVGNTPPIRLQSN